MAAGTVSTGEPIVGGGIRTVNFFNGRLLTGEDLTREQVAGRLARLQLGRAAGDGVACGLEVSIAPRSSSRAPVLRVRDGLAVNRMGAVLDLPSAIDVRLTRDRLAAMGRGRALFDDCAPLRPGTYTAGAGVYLLVIAPASRNEGRAEVSGLGNEDAVCNVAYSVEGVQLQLVRVVLPPGTFDPRERLRNRIAHLMLGTADTRRHAFRLDPLGPSVGDYGLLDDLRRAGCLDDRQVPLAVMDWTAAEGVRFVDLWSVRRRLTLPAADDLLPTATGDRRRAEAEATFLQFQAQVSDMLAAGEALESVTARDRFDHLPPVGIVPIASARSRGFDPSRFFGPRGSDELATLDAALLEALVEESFAHDPIEVAGPERIQRYVIWENERLVEDGRLARRAMVFARRTLPYRGIARYGRARYGRSRFAPSVI